MSKSEKKSIYRFHREKLGLTRDQASELLASIPPERIERIETGKILAHPEDVLAFSEAYKAPDLCNYYCSHECKIGAKYVPSITQKELEKIVLTMVASLNSAHRKQERLIEIAEDGVIDEKEIEDFIHIQEELEKISVTVEALQLWFEKMLADNRINRAKYEELKKRKRS